MTRSDSADGRHFRSLQFPLCWRRTTRSDALWHLIDFLFRRYYSCRFSPLAAHCWWCYCSVGAMTRESSFSAESSAVPWTHLESCQRFPARELSSDSVVLEPLASSSPVPQAVAFLPLDSCRSSRVSLAMSLNCTAMPFASYSCRNFDWSLTTKPSRARLTCISSRHRRENDESRCWTATPSSTPAVARSDQLRRSSCLCQMFETCRQDDETHICRASNVCSRKFCPLASRALSLRRYAQRTAASSASTPWRGRSVQTVHCWQSDWFYYVD